MDVIAIIPARGGSKGLPRKNLRMLGGKPLIAYSIAAACGAGLATLVSTEDQEIARTACALGAEVLARPLELAGDDITTNVVVEHVLGALAAQGRRFSHLALLQPTSPLRSAFHVAEGLASFEKSSERSLIAVCAADHHPYKDFRLDGGTLAPLFGAEFLERPRQGLDPVFRQNGALYVIGVRDFLATRRFYCPPCMPYVMSREDSIDIDNELDLDVAEAILRRRARPVAMDETP